MKNLIVALCVWMLLPALHAQPSRTDSLTSLLMASADLKEKAVLLLQRSKAWPSTQTDKPLADAQQALALYQQTKNQEGQVDAYLQISAVYARQNQYKLALTVDSSTLELASNIHYTKGRAQALSQMARNQYSMGSLRDAEKNCQQALRLFTEAGLESETADTHNRLGIIYRRLADIPRSLKHYDEGIAVARKTGDQTLLSILYMNKANSYNEAARHEEAINMHLESVRIKEKLRDERGLMQSYNNIALVFMRMNEFEKSRSYFLQANALATKYNNKTTLGYNFSNLANLSISQKKLDSVDYFYRQSLAAFTQTGEKPGLGLVHHNYGMFLMEQQHYPESENHLREALAIRRQTEARYDIASTMNVLGGLLSRTGRKAEAERLLLESLDMLKDENSSRKKDAYKFLAEHYKAAGDYEEAYKYQAGYIAMRDTLVTQDEITGILRAQSRYEVEKKEAELALAQKDRELQAALLSQKNQQLLYLLLALALTLLLLTAFYFGYRNKKKHAAELQSKNNQIETLIRELHHRIKNNLQVVSGLLSLQSYRTENEEARQAMDEGRSRVEAMAMIHQKLYMDKELAAVDMTEYLRNLGNSLAGSFGHSPQTVETTVDLPVVTMDIDRAIPIGLIVNELITNAFKHAFAGGQQPHVQVSLQQKGNALELMVADNGRGMNEATTESQSFGMKLVRTLVQQLDGQLETTAAAGTVFRIQINNKLT